MDLPREIIDMISLYLPLEKMVYISKWAISQTFKKTPERFYVKKLIKEKDNYDVIKWLYFNKKVSFDINDFYYSVKMNNTLVMRYFIDNFEITQPKTASILAVKNNCFNVLTCILSNTHYTKYLSIYTIDTAVISDNLEMFLFLTRYPNIEKKNPRYYFDIAVSNGSLDILRYFKTEYNMIISDKSLFNFIKKKSNPKALRYICKNFNPYVSEKLIRISSLKNDLTFHKILLKFKEINQS